MANEDVKQGIIKAGLRFWQVAEVYGCVDTTFSKKLRRELPDEEKAKIRSIIEGLKVGEVSGE